MYYPATVGIVTKHNGSAGGFKTVGPAMRTSDGGRSLDTIPATAVSIGSETTTRRKRK